jgi:hypothetical protein
LTDKQIHPEEIERESRRIKEMGRGGFDMFGPQDMDLLNDLIDGNYRNAFQLGYGGGQYVYMPPNTNSMSLSGVPTTWINVWGTWGPYSSYWVFVAPEDEDYSRHPNGECWTSNPPYFQFWDYDGRAAWPPQDRELFHFQLADPNIGTVTIRNYQDYVTSNAHDFFMGNLSQASQFFPVFCPRLELEIPPPEGLNIQQQLARLKKMNEAKQGILTAPKPPHGRAN